MEAKALFIYAALALALGSLVHVIGFFMGPDAIAFLGAPQEFVQGYRDGNWTWTAFITFSIAGLLAGLALLSWNAKASSNKALRAILWLFAFIFTLRGLFIFHFVPAIMAGRDGGDAMLFWFHVGASFFVLTIGLALGLGLWKMQKMVR